MLRVAAIMGLAALVMLCACATQPINPAPFDPKSHKLVPGDTVAISVFGEPDLTGRFLVNGAGEIVYPLVGALPARCKTTEQLADWMRTLFVDYVRNPGIGISISAYAPYRVDGAVARPGEYPFTPGLTAAQAIAASGGPAHGVRRARLRIEHACAANETGVAIDSSAPINPGDRLRLAGR